jgi:hypothetical protein
MDRKQKIIELARKNGLLRPRDVEAVGIQREYLLRSYRDGTLIRIGRGLYALPDTQKSEYLSLAEVSKRVPNAVICLISALEFHQLTTQIAHTVWIAIETKKWAPTFDYPPLEVVRFSEPALNYGVFEFDGTTLCNTVRNTFKRRATKLPEGLPIAFTDEFKKDSQKQIQWRAFIRKSKSTDEPGELDKVLDNVIAFLMPVINAANLNKNRPFKMFWPPNGPWKQQIKG